MRDAIEFRVPLPPVTLRANSSASRWQRTVDANTYSELVYGAWLEWCQLDGFYTHDGPWPRARVTYTWRYCGTAPDDVQVGTCWCGQKRSFAPFGETNAITKATAARQGGGHQAPPEPAASTAPPRPITGSSGATNKGPRPFCEECGRRHRVGNCKGRAA